MKRIISVFAVLALMAGMAMAQPSMYGSKGLIWTIEPGNAGPMNYAFGINGAYIMHDSTDVFPGKYTYMGIMPGGYFSINDMFEISLGTTYQMYSQTVAGVDADLNGLLDTRLGFKYSIKASDMIGLGAYLGYDIPTQGAIGDSLLKYNDPYKHTGMVHFLLLAGFDFGAADLNLNAGVDYNLDKNEVGGVDYVYPKLAIPLGLAFSYKAGDMFKPFVEFTTGMAIDSNKYGADAKSRSFLNYNSYVTPGVQVCFPFGMSLTAGFSYNLIDTADGVASKGGYGNPDWIGHFGLAYAPVKAAGPKVPPTGSISGTITDAKGKALAGATVSAGGLNGITDNAGNYTIAGIAITKAPVEIKAEAKGYIAKSGSVILTKKNKKTPAVQSFALDLKPIPMGAAKGMVKDAVTGAALEGGIAFAGPKAEAGKVVAGAYNNTLQVGNYTATVTVAEYFDKAVTVAITEKGTAMTDFAMLKKGTVVPVEVIWTAANKAMVKTVNVEAIVKMLNENPKAKVSITAYVDRVGGKKMNQTLANGRADAVRAELVKAGIDVARITTAGKLVVPAGKTKAAREANTKVEAIFVE